MWRPATKSDDDAIVRSSLALFTEDPSPERVDEAQVRRTLVALRGEPLRGRAIVLEEDGAILGHAFLIAFWSNELGGDVCTIDELYVAPSARTKGHASALIEALARGQLYPGAVALQLEVTPQNARALALYKKLGFDGKNVGLRRRVIRS
ncbi:MAG TPA: GNAT family N-acetyltransferase [Kofleriaceae bacterium]|nr:GNAT family N-acetyltransferase [Kofleriaceae bacterium]